MYSPVAYIQQLEYIAQLWVSVCSYSEFTLVPNMRLCEKRKPNLCPKNENLKFRHVKIPLRLLMLANFG